MPQLNKWFGKKAATCIIAGAALFSLVSGAGCLSRSICAEKGADAPGGATEAMHQATAPAEIPSSESAQVVTPEGGFAWHDLAMFASRRSLEDQLTALSIRCSDLENTLERAWRDPQLRLNTDFGSEKEFERGGDNGHEDTRDYGASLRFYISNPFVNQWIKKLGQPNARLIQAEARELAYAVYCETKMKCLEAAVIEDQIARLEETRERQKRTKERYLELRQAGQAAPLKIIGSDIRLAKTEMEIERRKREYRNAVFAIARLTGLKAGQIRLKPATAEQLAEPRDLSIDDLTVAAVNTRPDLESVRAAVVIAEAQLKVAQAKQIPWFEFAEAGYRNRKADSTRYQSPVNSRSNENLDEWMIRTAVSLPIFSWMGGETAFTRAVLQEAREREAVTTAVIYSEISNAVENYADAFDAHSRLRNTLTEQTERLATALRELESSKTQTETDIMDVEEKIHELRSAMDELLYDCLEAKIYLESVTGGIPLHSH